jgi:hypothetical protein
VRVAGGIENIRAIAHLEEDERDDFVRALRLRLSGRLETTAWLRILVAMKESRKS